MKKITWLLFFCCALSSYGQLLNWRNATPYGISHEPSVGAWHSGRVVDMVDYKDGSVLVGTETGGVWMTDQNGVAKCLTNDFPNPDIKAIERGPDGEHHIYVATSSNLYESRSAELREPTIIPLPTGAMQVNDIAIANGARRIIVGCSNGVFWSTIPAPEALTRVYNWQPASGDAVGSTVFSISTKSTGGAWQAQEQPTTDLITNRRLAIVNRSPVQRDLFWIAADGTVKSSWHTLGGNWAGHTFAVTGAGVASASSEIVAVTRHSRQIDLFYLGNGGELKSAWWNEDIRRWDNGTVFPAGTMRANSPLAAVSRSTTTLDVFGVGPTGRLVHAQWSQTLGWRLLASPAAAEFASLNTAVTVVARTPAKLDLFWLDTQQRLKTATWSANPAPTWSSVVVVSNADVVSSANGIAAVARTPGSLDLLWVTASGQLMTSFWNEARPEGWQGHAYGLTAQNIVAADCKVALLSRHPLQLDAFWKGRDAVIHTNWWYGLGAGSFAAQTYPLGPLDLVGGQIYASSAFDDELSLYTVTNAGAASCRRWTTDNCNVLIGYAAGQGGVARKGSFINGTLQLNGITLAGGNGVYSTASVCLSKYGTAGYIAVANPLAPNGLNGVFKSTDFGNVWAQTNNAVTGSTNTLQEEIGGQGFARNNTIAVSPTDNDNVFVGFVKLFGSRQGGSSWSFIASPHIHADIVRVVFGTYDRSGKTAYFCTDGGISSTFDAGFTSTYNRGLATLQCYAADGIRQNTGSLGVNYAIEGIIGVGTQDNGNRWTNLGVEGWEGFAGSPAETADGGYYMFLRNGHAIHSLGMQSAALSGLRRGEWRSGVTDEGFINVSAPANGETKVVPGGFTVVNSPLTLDGFGAAIEGYGWTNTSAYSLWKPSGVTNWRFVHETTPSLATGEILSAGASVNGNLLVMGTSNGRILEFDRIARSVTPKSVRWAAPAPSNADYGVNRIVMTALDQGYAIVSRWRNFTGNDPSYIFKFNGTEWRQLTFTDTRTALPAQRIFGLDVDWTSPNRTVVISTDTKIYMSRDGGTSWTDESTGLPTCPHLADVKFVSWPNMGRRFLVSSFGRGVWITNAP